MKIGILTFHNAHNYGAALQAYALKKKLTLMGHDAEIVNYQNKYIARLYRRGLHIDFWKRDVLPKRWPRLVKLAKNQRYGHKEWLRQWNAFEDFLDEHLLNSSMTTATVTTQPGQNSRKTLSVDDLSGLPMDAFILGSDQIWARELTHGLDAAYFGQFQTKARKISYAASVPNASIPESEQPYFKEYLSSLSAISVREEKLAKTLETLLNREVATVIDPTLLLERKDYDEIAVAPIMEKPYVFAYYVVESEALTACARKAAQKMGCTLVELHYARTPELDAEPSDIIRIYDAGPSQFLAYIRDAQMVLTNSFHGTVFSIMFEKKFYSVYEENGRIENLLGFLGLEERHIFGVEDLEQSLNTAKEIDYSNTKELLGQYRAQSEQFLQEALHE